MFSFSAHKKPTKNIFFGSRLERSSPRHAFRATSKPGVAAALRSCQQTWLWRRPELGLRHLDEGSFPHQRLSGHKAWGWALWDPLGGPSLPEADGAWPSCQGEWQALGGPDPDCFAFSHCRGAQSVRGSHGRAVKGPTSPLLPVTLCGDPALRPLLLRPALHTPGPSFTPQALTIQLVLVAAAVEPGVGSSLLPTGPSRPCSRACGPREE